MKAGDIVKAVWEAGLVLIGKYLKFERGYVILIDDVSKNIDVLRNITSIL